MTAYAIRTLPGSFVVTINESLCIGCNVCIPLCQMKAFERSEKGQVFVAREKSCMGCLKCYNSCPTHALKVYPSNVYWVGRERS